jgi:predicted ATP-grasp superfamily ATP-dependent carboligase
VLDRPEDLEAVAGFRQPLILKPVQPLSSFKTHIVHSLAEARAFVAGKLHDLPLLCQEYIEGGDEALHFGELLLDHGRPLFGMTGRKVLSHPPGQGQATVAETHADAEVLRLTERFFAGSNLSGPAALELKRDPQGGFWVIEPTIGRTEFLVELCIAAGFNQPWMEFELACGRPVEPPARLVERVWYDTERDPLAYLRLCRQHRSLAPRGKAPVFPYWGHGDVGPWRRAMAQAVRDRWSRLR